MSENLKLQETLKDLKLKKRSFLLSGKDTQDIDMKIKEIEIKINNSKTVCKPILE